MATAQQVIPLTILIAPFPEGFQGNLDETFQQAFELVSAYVQGNFLTGLILPPGSTLPTSDVGPIAMGGQWYFWDTATNQYLPQTVSAKMAKNFVKNCVYQVQQTGSTFTLGVGLTQLYDLSLARTTVASVLSVASDTGPVASVDTDTIGSAIRYTVGPSLIPSPASTDLMTHEHLLEGTDILPLQGQTLSLSFSAWANQTGTYSVYLTSPGRDASYVANFIITSASTWTRIKIAGIAPLPTGTGTWHFGEGQTGLYIGAPLLVGTQWQVGTTHLLSWQPAFLAGTSANTNLCTVIGNQLKLTGFKLEASPSVSYLTVPPFENDFEDAIRYYWTSFNYQSLTVGVPLRGASPQAGQISFSNTFPRRMCGYPVVTPYSYRPTPVSGYLTNASLNIDVALANLTATPKGINYYGNNANLVIYGNTHSSTTIDGMTTTSGVLVGMPVSGSGIPTGATVATIVSGTSITISAAATTTLLATPLTFSTAGLVLNGVTHGNTTIDGLSSTAGLTVGMPVTANPNVVLNGNIHNGTTTIDGLSSTSGLVVGMGVTGPPNVVIYGNTHSNTTIDGLASTTGLLVGMLVNGSGIPALATIATIASGTSITISAAATATATGVSLSFTNGVAAPPLNIVTIASGTSVTVSGASLATVSGMPITFSYGIPAGTTVASIVTGSSITISNAATSGIPAGTSLTFGTSLKGDTLLAYVTADARFT